MESRPITQRIIEDLKKKMVFVGGPRQCGKTTLTQEILAQFPYPEKNQRGIYFNWDRTQDRKSALQEQWLSTDHLLVFDELHKEPQWKRWIKGIYDTQKDLHRFVVTGSARLDVYQRGGDSLMGRYHYWRLHPFTLAEIPKGIAHDVALDRLLKVGGFPEPFLENDERIARRWRKERFVRVIHEDIRDLNSVKNIQTLSLFIDLLRKRVGGLVVLSNLAQELQVSSNTVKHWLEVLERMYFVFAVRPYSKNIPRALLKPPKVYFFDNADVIGDEGARFENLVATTLLRQIHFIEDYYGYNMELRYLRDKEGREIDFVILKNGNLEHLIEVKWADEKISRSLQYYKKKLNPPRTTQIVRHAKHAYEKSGIQVQPILNLQWTNDEHIMR